MCSPHSLAVRDLAQIRTLRGLSASGPSVKHAALECNCGRCGCWLVSLLRLSYRRCCASATQNRTHEKCTSHGRLQVLGLHVIEGAFKAADLSDGRTLTTLGGATLTVSLGDGTVSFTAGDGANVGTVLTADLMSCSGVLHIIDTALSPPTSATNPPTVTPPPITPPTGNPPPVDPPAGDAPVATTPSTDPPTTEPVPVDPPTLPPPVLPPPAEVRPPAPKGPTLTLPPPVTFPPVNVPPFSFPTVATPPLPTLNPPPGPFFPVPPFLKPPTGTPTGGSFVTKKGSTSSKKVESSESDSASVSP